MGIAVPATKSCRIKRQKGLMKTSRLWKKRFTKTKRGKQINSQTDAAKICGSNGYVKNLWESIDHAKCRILGTIHTLLIARENISGEFLLRDYCIVRAAALDYIK
mmetsp:Transcript_21009/g.52110  ORF Transcript_21009/g.52110 Transcript_21009/m.52110 type:complete len:105 (+) Transcript_21009:193-507(+)